MTLYSYAKFDGYDLAFLRVLGVGLGNLMFPWARFAVATARFGLVPLAPTWFQLKIGPFIRGERDKRLYGDLFSTPVDHVSGWSKIAILARLPRINEDKFMSDRIGQIRCGTVVFEGIKNYFSDFLREHELIRQRLLDMTRAHHLGGLNYKFGESISVHVRLGDFGLPSVGRTAGAPCVRVPLSWYVNKARQLRRLHNRHIPVYVFSDGTDNELDELLAEPGVNRLSFGSALADMIALSCSHVLIASPGSTFSQWAAFLGRMPVVWYPTPSWIPLYYDKPAAEIASADDAHIPESFIVCAQFKA